MSTGRRQFQLQFYHANYPEGVRDKLVTLETIERGTSFMLGRSTEHDPTHLLLISEMSWEWLLRHFSVARPDDELDVQRWLDENA